MSNFSFKKEDLFGAQSAVNALNNTDKEFKKKRFDFSIK